MITPSQTSNRTHSVSTALEAHARSQRDPAPAPQQRIDSEPRTIPPAVAEVMRYTFGA